MDEARQKLFDEHSELFGVVYTKSHSIRKTATDDDKARLEFLRKQLLTDEELAVEYTDLLNEIVGENGKVNKDADLDDVQKLKQLKEILGKTVDGPKAGKSGKASKTGSNGLESDLEIPTREKVLSQDIPVVKLERELRRYVPPKGGYRTGLSEKDKVKCQVLMKKLGRKKIQRDPSIIIPGMDVRWKDIAK